MKCLPNYTPIGKDPKGFGHPALGIFGIGTDSFLPQSVVTGALFRQWF